jgi:hypothetical protein
MNKGMQDQIQTLRATLEDKFVYRALWSILHYQWSLMDKQLDTLLLLFSVNCKFLLDDVQTGKIRLIYMFDHHLIMT